MINNKSVGIPKDLINFREVVTHIKWLYDNEGPDAVVLSIGNALDKISTNDQKEKLCILVEIFYKMETCVSDCFDYMELKDICICACNDNKMEIPLDYDMPMS